MNNDLATSTNFSDNGFGDTDNWASTAVALNKNLNNSSTTNTSTATSSKNANLPVFPSQPESNSDNWANFDDGTVINKAEPL